MIEKMQKLRVKNEGAYDTCDAVEKFNMIIEKTNELVDAINTIQKEREAERFEIQEWISIIEAVRESVNIHEKQIDELQMKAEPEKCKAPIDPYEEQRKWIGKLCRFRDKHSDVWEYGTLENVEDVDHAIDCAFRSSDGYWYDICESIKPDSDIIYKEE